VHALRGGLSPAAGGLIMPQFPMRPGQRLTVAVESPFAGDLERNARYLRAILRHLLLDGYAPFASHGLYTLPGVLECAAVGIPDEKAGEAIKLVIVKRTPDLTEEQVRAHCRANLTAYKCPKQIVFVEALPKSTVGKILRRELRG
jgi:hypothetical protein